MERDDVDGSIQQHQSPPRAQLDGQASLLSCTLSLDHVGQVSLSSNSDGLSWRLLEPLDNDDSTCLCIKFASMVATTEIKFADVYAVELINYGVIHGSNVSNARKCLRVNVSLRRTALQCMVSRAQGLFLFGVPIEATVQRQQSSRPIPHILVNCADYLILSGLNTPYLFKGEGDKKVIQQLISMCNQDSNASIPEGVSSIDVAALVKCYLATLPEPLTTLELYNEIRGSRSGINAMRNTLKKLPTVNYTTLEFITALLLRVSQKSVLNKMDTQSLAMEMAPVIIWQKGRAPDLYKKYWNQPSKGPSKKNSDPEPTYSAWDMLSDKGDTVDDSISLDDGVPIDLGAIEVVPCLMEHHNAIFTDANETVWRRHHLTASNSTEMYRDAKLWLRWLLDSRGYVLCQSQKGFSFISIWILGYGKA